MGKKVVTPGFIGYQKWDNDTQDIIIVTKENGRLRRADSDNGSFTSDEWEIDNGPTDPRESDLYRQINAMSASGPAKDLDQIK